MLLGTINTKSYPDRFGKTQPGVRSSLPLKIGPFRVASFSFKTPGRKVEDKIIQRHLPDPVMSLRGIITWVEPTNHNIEYVTACFV